MKMALFFQKEADSPQGSSNRSPVRGGGYPVSCPGWGWGYPLILPGGGGGVKEIPLGRAWDRPLDRNRAGG